MHSLAMPVAVIDRRQTIKKECEGIVNWLRGDEMVIIKDQKKMIGDDANLVYQGGQDIFYGR